MKNSRHIRPDGLNKTNFSHIKECSIMLHKEFPSGDSNEEKAIARMLCIKDSLLGAFVITLIFMVIDQSARDISPWWSYLLLAVSCYLGECMANWRRYQRKIKAERKNAE